MKFMNDFQDDFSKNSSCKFFLEITPVIGPEISPRTAAENSLGIPPAVAARISPETLLVTLQGISSRILSRVPFGILPRICRSGAGSFRHSSKKSSKNPH